MGHQLWSSDRVNRISPSFASPIAIALDEAISTSPAKLDEVIDALRADLGEVIDTLRAGTEVVDQAVRK